MAETCSGNSMTDSYTTSLMEQRFRELNARLDSIEAQLDIIRAAIAAAALSRGRFQRKRNDHRRPEGASRIVSYDSDFYA